VFRNEKRAGLTFQDEPVPFYSIFKQEEIMEFTMLEELEDIETPDTRDFLEGFVDGMTAVGGVVALVLIT
jgi:hypothetical protein